MPRDYSGDPTSDRLAPRPCYPCQARKRRCGKESPECALCLRTGRRCRYNTDSETAKDLHYQGAGQDLVPNQFPVTYFLDRRVFNHCQMTIEKPHLVIPFGDLDCLKTAASIRHVADRFFESIHIWLPILSRNKVYGNIIHQELQPDADFRILVASMQILLTQQSEDAHLYRQIYQLLKHQVVCLEQAGVFSITALQSMIFIALYEIGHGIYPAAYLSVGMCARYAVALGLDRTIFKWAHTDSEWAAMEEKHRVWWAIVILERYLNIDAPRRPICTPDPSERNFLPLSDDDWNNGVRSGVPYTVATPTNANMGKFARLAQASHLLSRVMRHICDTQADRQFLDREKTLLDHALRSLLSLTVAEEQQCGIAYCSPVALLCSALLLIHSYSHNVPASLDTGVDHGYLEAIKTTSEATVPIAYRLKDHFSSFADISSPLVLDWMYRSFIAYNEVPQTNDVIACDNYVGILKGAMKELSRRWSVGVFYLDLIETRSITSLTPKPHD